MAANGMIVTMLGEFYLNFSYLGIVLIPFVLAYILGAWSTPHIDANTLQSDASHICWLLAT